MRVQEYQPKYLSKPSKLAKVPTAWEPNQNIIEPILIDFGIKRNKALEFGVDYGFSLSAFANFFHEVIGVDTFEGDKHAGERKDQFKEVQKTFEEFPNVKLVKSDFRDFITTNDDQYDLIHIDIVHDYEPTFECGLWAAKHAQAVLFHDTCSHSDVMRAVADITQATGKKFYNYQTRYGLGILV